MLPYANCKTASVRLPLPEGSVSRIDFLQFYAGVGALDQAVGYYKGLDPAMVFTADATSPNGGTWSGGNHSTLGAWWALAGFDTNGAAADEARAPYLNYNDLGFGRDMHIRKAANGDVFAYVTNYGAADQNPTNADLAQTANKSAALATVAMEAAALTGVTGRVVKFWVYQGGSATGALLNSADLDGFGQKYVPQLCQTCHGGSLYSPITATAPTAAELSLRPGLSSSVGASFREFDVGSFRYAGNSPTPDQALITAFNTLNDFVKDSGPQGAILELIDGWHPTGTPQTTAPNLAFTPPGWTGDPQREQLYHDVVAKSCRTCLFAIRAATHDDPIFCVWEFQVHAACAHDLPELLA
jgi:hypothetical protein